MHRDHTELVIALAGAVGTDLGMVSDVIASELADYGFDHHICRLSVYLAEQADHDFRKLHYDERVWDAMTAGDELRERWERGDALALHAISDIVATREELAGGYSDPPYGASQPTPNNLSRFAFILHSLKTPDELETLRAVYGPRFIVMGAYSPYLERLAHLTALVEDSRKNKDTATWTHSPDELIKRDAKEDIAGGQALRDTFHRADFFIRAWDRAVVKQDVARTLEILFGHPFRTPTKDEFGQFQAAGAALRSAELGRQVGAALATTDGSIVSLGSNEVPRFGGGSHWEDDGLGNRDFETRERDSNREQFDELARRLAKQARATLERLAEDAAKGRALASMRPIEEAEKRLMEDLRRGGLGDLTEFGRAVHAEMAAILDAARRGVSVGGATLYTTTFPCHNCARHIVGVGIERVVFIEPYDKSRALDLHPDSIISEGTATSGKVKLEPFVGVAPRRYIEMFDAAGREHLGHAPRRMADGSKGTFIKAEAYPVLVDGGLSQFQPELPGYRARELLALEHFERLSGSDEKASVE